MAKSFKKLQGKMSPASRARSEAIAQKMIKEMALDELRAARDLTQEHLSRILGNFSRWKCEDYTIQKTGENSLIGRMAIQKVNRGCVTVCPSANFTTPLL